MRSLIRKPSLKKSFKARTTGRAKRAVKKAIVPGYGQKGMGIANPKRALYNKTYNATSIDALKTLKNIKSSKIRPDEISSDGFYEMKKLGWFGKKVSENDLKPSDLPVKLEVSIEEENNKRINTKTGYRVFVQSKINQANSAFLKSITPHREKNQKDVLIDYINPRFYFGLMAYRMGEYELAEQQLFKLVYLMPKANRLLAMLYRKEKRYHDAYLVIKEGQQSTVAQHLYTLSLISDEEILKTKELADNRQKNDKSKLHISIFENLRK